MKIVLILNALIEGLVGLLFIFSPQSAPHLVNADVISLYLAGMYGFAALTISFFSVLLLLGIHHHELLVNGLLTLTVFHVGILASQLISSVDSGMSTPPAILHGVFFILFLIFYLRER
ncbi:MAG: hypothetical protein NW226_23465 [Microscillaceae bacterium]|nr:hypothetical protein [Microscillaceae bacterium]